MFSKVLIANRGEIAVRVIRSVQAAGYAAVAVHSEADADAPHVRLADEAVLIGPPTVARSYLDIEALLEAARRTGADAVHPGYGFLSERDDFARACEAAGLVFIGPSPEAIALMGNKRVAKQRMLAADVPCIPGYQEADQSDEALLVAARSIGVPLMVKAAAGGGGRGMRLVYDLDDLAEILASARSEALNAFGSDELILEKAVIDGRHIEIQVAADSHGNVVHLGERDCSIQRRHQKVIEEAPSPFVSPELREAMGGAAVAAARACDYRGVGTVEFLVDAEGAFYFLEMNTRLQVEHPVTELVTGVDLVDWQLRIAAGETLPRAQSEIALSGHAIEARLYAEDPAAGFLPQTGPILAWQVPEGEGVRVDHGIAAGGEVTPHYDPMLAKIIASGRDREEARRRLDRALANTHLLGLTSNRGFLRQLIGDPRFIDGAATTALIDEEVLARAAAATRADDPTLALAAVLFAVRRGDAGPGGWRWSNAASMPVRLRLAQGEEARPTEVRPRDEGFLVTLGENEIAVALQDHADGACGYAIDGIRRHAVFAFDGDSLHLDAGGTGVTVEDRTYLPARSEDDAASGNLTASTEGLVVAINVAEGERVSRGQTLITVEAMKMEHRHTAGGDGVVRTINTSLNVQVRKGQLLAELDLDSLSGE